MGRGERGCAEKQMGGRWGGATGTEAKQRGAADGAGREGRRRKKRAAVGAAAKVRGAADVAGREGRRRKKEGLPMWRGERGGGERYRGGGERKRGGRWGEARGAAAKERGAADGAGRERRRRNQEGRLMGWGERG